MPRTKRKRDESEASDGPPLKDGDNFEVVRGLMMTELPCDLPSEKLQAGDTVMVQQGEAILEGALGLIRIHSKGCLALGRIFQLDPDHVRVGSNNGPSLGDVYEVSDIEMIGPVVSGGCKFVPLGRAESEQAVGLFESAFPDDDDWPDVIEA